MAGGGAFLPSRGEEYDLGGGSGPNGGHAVQWVGTPSVKGPKWAKLPLLTIGMLGIQVCRRDSGILCSRGVQADG